MKKCDLPRFCAAMFWLAEKYPTGKAGEQVPRALSVEWLDDYFEAFGDIRIERFEAGVKFHYAHDAFFPDRPAPLRKYCEALPTPQDGWLVAPERVLVPEAPASLAKDLLLDVAKQLNEKFGTRLFVDADGILKGDRRRVESDL